MLEAFSLLPRDVKLLPLNGSGSSSAPELCPVSGCGSTSHAVRDHLWHWLFLGRHSRGECAEQGKPSVSF